MGEGPLSRLRTEVCPANRLAPVPGGTCARRIGWHLAAAPGCVKLALRGTEAGLEVPLEGFLLLNFRASLLLFRRA